MMIYKRHRLAILIRFAVSFFFSLGFWMVRHTTAITSGGAAAAGAVAGVPVSGAEAMVCWLCLAFRFFFLFSRASFEGLTIADRQIK
jgi:hypothetical protein